MLNLDQSADTAPPQTSPQTSPASFRAGIVERIRSMRPSLAGPAAQLLAAPGKGIRPACVRLVGAAFHVSGRSGDRHELLAEALELLHVGSLVHDDILDEASTRRGIETVHITWGTKVAVLAGDYLMAQSSMRISALDDPYLTRRLAEVISDLCEGELLQDEQLFKLDVTTEAYLERIAKKTASPFELASEGAARISGADTRAVAVARRFGFHLGRVFQLVDDWLDWAGDEADLGKPVGRDLLAGSLTLPVLVALADSEVGPRLRARLIPFPTEIDDTLRRLISQESILAETRALVTEEGERARRWLTEFPAGESKDQLDSMLTALLSQVAAPGAED